MNKSTAVRLSGILMILLGIGMLLASVYFVGYNSWFLITADSTDGKIVGWQDMETRPGIQPIWEQRAKSSLVLFKNQEGRDVFFATDVGSEDGLYSHGEEVVVLYKPQNPEDAIVRDFKSLYLGPLLLIPFGVVFGFMGVMVKAFGESSKG